jgi:hypothetical protein
MKKELASRVVQLEKCGMPILKEMVSETFRKKLVWDGSEDLRCACAIYGRIT